VVRVAPNLVEAAGRAGILVMASDDVRVTGNVVDEIGAQEQFLGIAAGIAVLGPFERLSVSDNSSRFGPERPAPAEGGWFALLIQSAGRVVTRVGAQTAVVPVRAGAVVLNRAWAAAAAARGDHVGVALNTLSGGGNVPTCLVRVGGDVVAEGNQCRHEQEGEAAGILLQAGSITASSNRVRGVRSMLVLEVPENRFAAVGNLAAGGTHLGGPGGGLPSPWQPLNPTVP
jgi:hypothetical protein